MFPCRPQSWIHDMYFGRLKTLGMQTCSSLQCTLIIINNATCNRKAASLPCINKKLLCQDNLNSLHTKYLSDNIKPFILAGIPASQQFRLIVYNTTVVWIYTSVLQTKICFIGTIWILGKLLVQVHSCKFYNITSGKINFYTFRFLLPALQALPSAWLWNTVVNLWSTVIYFGVL